MGLLDKAYEQSKINSLDSSEVKDVGEACNELDNVRQTIADKEAEIKKLKDREYQLENEVIPSFFETAGVSAISLMDGSKVSIKDQTRANITQENQEFCFGWLKQNGLDDIKLLMFSPYEDFKVAGLETRKNAPCVLYNLAKKKDLYESSEKLKKTKWYDNFLTEDFKKLAIKKHKKLL